MPEIGTSGRPAEHAASHDSTVAGATTKLCCVCGENVAGKKRYKDSAGRYWCPDCHEAGLMPGGGVATAAVTTEPCPDCKQEFAPSEFVDIAGTRVCPACAEKRKQAAKRKEARVRAAVEEGQKDQARMAMIMNAAKIGGAVICLLILVIVLYNVFHH